MEGSQKSLVQKIFIEEQTDFELQKTGVEGTSERRTSIKYIVNFQFYFVQPEGHDADTNQTFENRRTSN